MKLETQNFILSIDSPFRRSCYRDLSKIGYFRGWGVFLADKRSLVWREFHVTKHGFSFLKIVMS